MGSVRNVGRRRADGPRADRPVTAFSLLARPDPEGSLAAPDRQVSVPAGLLSDLHDPRLIITAEYVGPDRRLLDRREWRSLQRERTRYRAWPPARPGPKGQLEAGRVGRPISFRLRHLVAAVLLTAVTVVPLTVLVSHRAAPAIPTSPTSPAPRASHPAPGTPFRP